MNNIDVIKKIDSFIVEIQFCQENNQFEELKLRIRTYLQGIYGSHPYSNKTCLNKEYENVDSYGKQAVSAFFTGKMPNRRLTKNIDPIINHLREVREVISKDGLPLNLKHDMMININNSPGANVAAGNMGNTIQSNSVSMSDFNKHYQPAIDEINNSDLTEEQREELLDMLALFKDSVDKNETPKKAILKALGKYSLLAISIGANMVALWGFIEPYIN